MSQQGDRATGHEDDWWGQLYDDSTGDTGAASAADTLDDRFASAVGTVGKGTDTAVPGAGPAAPRTDPSPLSTPSDPGDSPRRSGPAGPPAPWEPPSARQPGPVTFPPGPTPPGFRAEPPQDGMPMGAPSSGRLADALPSSSGHGSADGLSRPADAYPPLPDRPPVDAPPPPPGYPPAEPAPPRFAGKSPAPPGPSSQARTPAPAAAPATASPPAESAPPPLTIPDTPPPVDHVGSGPPTYDAEPTAIPLADPDDLADLVADTVLDGARYGACTLRAVSVRGDSARFRGEPRRDSLLTARFGTGDQALVLVAMATGARATPGAHRAAAEVCHWIGRAVGRSYLRLGEDIRAARRGDLKSGLHRLTDRSLGKLRASAAEQGVAPEEYTATLRCLLLPADPACRTRVFFGVGEGGLFRLRDGDWQDIEPPVAEATGEAVVGFGSLPSETPEGDRLTMDLGITTPPSPYEPSPEPPRDPFRFRASIARPGDTLLLCTSGLADPLRGQPQLAEHLTTRWSTGEPPGLAAFFADTLVRVKGYADDRTAAAVWEA
ncbi:protein phosphatase 2C domain-containing protein [Streptomyces sp. NPDC001795]|uniref:protein phosphatase 2C domain-containing protein n=1 Tax=Streptomyces sp. NPDC001795 TaxID=3154525 RepID=UPI003324FC2C